MKRSKNDPDLGSASRSESGSVSGSGSASRSESGSVSGSGSTSRSDSGSVSGSGKGSKKLKKRSIAMELSVLFIGLLLLVMVAMLCLNNLYLTRFYELRLQNTLKKAYVQVDAHVSAETGVDTEYFENEFRNVERSRNIALVISDPEFGQVIEVLREEDEVMAARLNAYSMGLDQDDVTIIEKNEDYIIQKKPDEKYQMEFLEMWGILPSSSYHFMMRIPMESIRLNAKISNEFIFYCILITGFIGIFMIGWLSRRIARPVRELSELSERMANLDFDAKYTSGGRNEIGQLGENFNQMSETLERTIAELKTANNELQKNLDEKTKIDDMRREFLSNVSHELKTPLALIQGYAEGLQDSVADDPESRDYYCEVIVDEAEKMNTLVRKLLALNQLEFGEDEVEMVRFDLAELIRGKVNSSRLLADQKCASLEYEGPDSLDVWGDEFKVEEVLTNYLSNAINHVDDNDSGHCGSHTPSAPSGRNSSGDGSGEASPRRIIVRAGVDKDSGKVRVRVFNTGSHIPEEDLDQVWDKFFKVDKARTREYGGSGVGLSIVRAIMESFHQKFGVRNVDDGVEFWFELDYAGVIDSSEESADAKDKNGSSFRFPGREDRRERREREAAEKETMKRMRREMREKDEVIDAEWVSTEGEQPPEKQ